MRAIVKSFSQSEGPQEHDPVMLDLFDKAGVEKSDLAEARDAGMSWVAILQLILQYGPQFMDVLKLILASRGVQPAPEPQRRSRKRREAVAGDPEAGPEESAAEPVL